MSASHLAVDGISKAKTRKRKARTVAANGGGGSGGGGGGGAGGGRMEDGTAECLFERLRQLQHRSPDATELARTITARLCTRLASHDKNMRQHTLDKLWNKSTGALQVLLALLENSRDFTTTVHCASILRETLCLKQGKGEKCSAPSDTSINKKKTHKETKKENKDPKIVTKKANNLSRQSSTIHLISMNGTQTVIRSVLATQGRRDGNVSTEAFLVDLVWILAAISQKDQKFALRMRMLGCCRTMHLILKTHFTDNKYIFPLLVIMKQLSKNSQATSILARDGVIATYERVLVSLGFIPTARLRLCLDAIDYFSKNRVCCMQLVKTGLCHLLLRVFDRWDRYEGRIRLKICAHILQALQHLCTIKAGRRALCTKKHVQTLHRFCTQCPDEPEFDGLLARVCAVITLCLKHQTLPVPPVSPATFNLNPILKGTNIIWPMPNEDDEDGLNSDSKIVNSDDDNQDDLDTEDELVFTEYDESELSVEKPLDLEKMYSTNKSADSFNSTMWMHPNERDIEDLKRYSMFFKEFGTFNRQVRLVRSRSNSGSVSKGSIFDNLNVPNSANRLNICTGLSFQELLLPSEHSLQRERSISPTIPDIKRFQAADSKASMNQSSSSSLKIHKDISRYSNFAATYCMIASRVRSVIPFVKVAYPDMIGGDALCLPEPLHKTDRSTCRSKLLSCVDRAINPDASMNEVAYDLDMLCYSTYYSTSISTHLSNADERDLLNRSTGSTKLTFESRFESGNLRKAIQIGPREYELVLMPDVNSNKRLQWFYFEVRNMQHGKPYVFNVVNCEKNESQFKSGMKPVMYSVKEAILGKPGWIRAGTDICYYRNSYNYGGHQKNHNKCYHTVTFTIIFPHPGDVCYIAYHYPYTYSTMMAKIWKWSHSLPPNTYFRVEPLCHSLNNNEVPLITISADDTTLNPIAEREIVFLTARVHPGESNASWVMDGTLSCLLGSTPSAAKARDKFVFKIVPMLNVEGVINGCHRCGLTNEDLNRRWCKPSPVLHPTIYHTKGLIEYLVRVWKKAPTVYCDYHGHSRMKNVFFYGCSSAESWCSADKLQPNQPVKYLMLPALMHRVSPAFALGSCSFRVERTRESTARVTVWRHLGVAKSYTMEASFCGFDQGPFKGLHLNTQHLQNVGGDICEALVGLSNEDSIDIHITKDLQGQIIEISIQRSTDSDKDSGNAGDSESGSGSDSVLRSDSDEDFD